MTHCLTHYIQDPNTVLTNYNQSQDTFTLGISMLVQHAAHVLSVWNLKNKF